MKQVPDVYAEPTSGPFSDLYELGGEVYAWEVERSSQIDSGTVGERDYVFDLLGKMFADGDSSVFRRVGWHPIDRLGFLGSWYDPCRKALIYNGQIRNWNGRKFLRPTFAKYASIRLRSGASATPPPGTSDFSYTVANPPYGYGENMGKVSDVFDTTLQYIFPSDDVRIMNFCSTELEALEWFKPGASWWGMYLWVLLGPGSRTLVIAAAATD